MSPGLAWNPHDCGPEDERECTDGCASHEGGDCDCQDDDGVFGREDQEEDA